jgi:Major Facilitator Superfamily
VMSNVAQVVVGRLGVRTTLTLGLLASAISVAALTRLPVDGTYFWDLFPWFVLGGAGMGFSFVPVTIAGLTGVERSDAGVASGLINTSRQIGGAIGIAAVSAIAATSTSNFAESNAVGATSGAALAHGFQTGLYVLTGLLLAGALVAFALVRSHTAQPVAAPAEPEAPPVGAVDDLVLHLRGLIAVRELRESRGAGEDELRVYGDEITRVKEQLVEFARSAA